MCIATLLQQLIRSLLKTMYNGIGLQTARGSGTSGYVQKNVSYNVKKLQTKQQFLKRLQQARRNNLPPPRKANAQIIQHQRKRQILIKKMELKAKLQQQGLPEQQIKQRLQKAEKIMRQKLQKGQIQTKNKDTHIMTEAKQRQYMKLTEAFGLKQVEKSGSAFDFEAQKQERLKYLQQKRKKFSFMCTQQGCEKVYDSQHRLDRHLRHKHPQARKQITDQKQATKLQANNKQMSQNQKVKIQ